MDRTTLIEALRGHVDRDARIRVAWLGGSDATGRTDELSDLDPMLAAKAGDIEGVFESMESWLEDTVGIRERHRFPDPTPHGHPQAMYLGERISEDLAIDLVVMDVETPVADRFLDEERHGTAVVLVDREGWFDEPVSLDRNAHRRRIREHLSTLAALHPHLMPLVRKSLIRGERLDALTRYRNRLLKPLCDLMRIEHDPDRYDFGFRYLDRDLPESERRLLERLSFIGIDDDLSAAVEEARREVESRLDRLVTEFDRSDRPA
ncbi:MAG: hypothetical protein CMJ34_04825 [Phycisphaerae bacterium]|nr:hypothetical protein [Phycisphaerae bacterium]